MDHQVHYANAIRAEPGVCWRMVSREPGHRVDAPTDCPEPVQWVERAVVGHKRMRLWSWGRLVEGPANLRPAAPRSPLRVQKVNVT